MYHHANISVDTSEVIMNECKINQLMAIMDTPVRAIVQGWHQEGLVSQTESYSRERWSRYPSMSLTTPFSSKKEGSLESLRLTPNTLVLLRNDVEQLKEQGKRWCQFGAPWDGRRGNTDANTALILSTCFYNLSARNAAISASYIFQRCHLLTNRNVFWSMAMFIHSSWNDPWPAQLLSLTEENKDFFTYFLYS